MSDEIFGEWVTFVVLLVAIPYIVGVPLAIVWALTTTFIERVYKGERE